jgi:hypothetical protein
MKLENRKEIVIMKKSVIFIILTTVILFAYSTSACAWIYYSKPEFRGKVIDAQTKTPIEGAVVVVIYMKHEFISGPGGGSTVPMNAKETLSDKNGEFYFPSYRTMSNPLTLEDRSEFIFFKPGYKAIDDLNGLPIKIPYEKYFAIKKDIVGKDGEIKHSDTYGTLHTYTGPLGIVELKKTKPNESMSGSMPNDYGEKDLPLLYKAIEEDDIIRGLLPKSGRKK